MRNQTSSTASPSVLFFYHVPKTGGSTVREWFLRNAGLRVRGLPARLHGVLRYWEAQCFMCLQFSDLFGVSTGCTEAIVRGCHEQWKPDRRPRPASFNPVRSDWSSTGRLAVEFHGMSADFFVRQVLPRSTALRHRIAMRGGTSAFVTLTRAPVELLFSAFHMWPPRPSPGTVMPFPIWMWSSRGMLTAELAEPACVASDPLRGQYVRCGCDSGHVEAAVANLRRFDVVGLTECMTEFYDAVEAAIGWPDESVGAALQRRSRAANASAGLLHSKPKCVDCTAVERTQHEEWTWQSLNATVRQELHTLVDTCDSAVYTESLRRATRGRVSRGRDRRSDRRAPHRTSTAATSCASKVRAAMQPERLDILSS